MRREGGRRLRRALSAPTPRAILSALRRHSERAGSLQTDRKSLLLNVDYCEETEEEVCTLPRGGRHRRSGLHHIQVVLSL